MNSALKTPAIFVLGALLGAGATAIVLHRPPAPSDETDVPVAPGSGTVQRHDAAARDEARMDRAIRDRLRVLSAQLAKGTTGAAAARTKAQATNENPVATWSFAQYFAKLKLENPERYVQQTNMYADMRRNRAEHLDQHLEFLNSIDISHMSEEDQAGHARLVELATSNQELEDMLANPDLDAATAEQLQAQVTEQGLAVCRLEEKERDALLRETARSLGYSPEDQETIAETVKAVYSATGLDTPPRPPPARMTR